jgi:pimeloyl-ACP methyl ester carboxylesterase
VAWIHNNTPHRAQTLTYFTGPILAGATRNYRAKQLAKLIKAYKGWRIVIVAHSEGTATGLRALRDSDWPGIAELHLLCGAADSDCDANGLNRGASMGAVEKIFVYVAGRDEAMKLEDSYIGSLCFGLQTAGQPMGLKGPTKMSAETEVRTVIIPGRTTDIRRVGNPGISSEP